MNNFKEKKKKKKTEKEQCGVSFFFFFFFPFKTLYQGDKIAFCSYNVMAKSYV